MITANFPNYEILYNDDGKISTQDYVYIFSLVLFHSCVLMKDENFQKCCNNLDGRQQTLMVNFLKYMRKSCAKISKEMLRHAIKQVAKESSPPHFIELGSPLKTPTKLERSPPPKEYAEIKMREFKHLKTQLENERFERNLLEVEMKQSHEKIESLVKKCRDLGREVQCLRNDMFTEKNNENITPNVQREELMRAKLEKKIKSHEDTIEDLRAEIAELKECKEKFVKKATMIDQERRSLLVKLSEFDFSYKELQTELDAREEKIQYLEKSNNELLQILNETRASQSRDADSSSDFTCSTYHTMGNNSSGENLGSIIDLQLKEKESENSVLKDLLASANNTKDDLEVTITALQNTISNLRHDIQEQEESRKSVSSALNQKIDLLKEKLQSTIRLNEETQQRERALEDQLAREKKFNDKINSNTIIMKGKIKIAREQLSEAEKHYADAHGKLIAANQENEKLKTCHEQEKKNIKKTYEEKLEKLKQQMVSHFLNHILA